MNIVHLKEALKSHFGPAQKRQAAQAARVLRSRAALVLDQARLAIKAKIADHGIDYSFEIPRTAVLIGIVAVFLVWTAFKMLRRRRSLTKMFVTPKAIESIGPACSSTARPPIPHSSPPPPVPISLRRCPSQRQTSDPPKSPGDPSSLTPNPSTAVAAAASADIRALQLGQEQLSKAVATLLAWRTEKEASSPTPHPVDNHDTLFDDLTERVAKTEEDLVEVVHEVQRTTLRLDEWAGLPQAHAWVSEMVKSLLTWRAQTLAREATAPVYATKAEMELSAAHAKAAYEKLAAATGEEVAKVLHELQAKHDAKKGNSIFNTSTSSRRASVTAVEAPKTGGSAKDLKHRDIPLFKRLADGGLVSHAFKSDGEGEGEGDE